MHYRKLRTSRPPVLFDLQMHASLARLESEDDRIFAPPGFRVRMCDYIESLLLADNRPPKSIYISMLAESFAKLIALSQSGKPFIYKKRNTVSLLFDVAAIQSEMRLEAPDELVLGYTQTMMGFLLFNPAPVRIGMIGLGGGSLPKYCHRYLPQSEVIVVENDPNVIALRDQFCVPQDSGRFEVRCGDGADFVQDAFDRFDVLIVDGFDRAGQPAQLCSQKFYDDCFSALAQDGMAVINLLGDVLDTDTYLDRLRLSFDGALIVIDDRDSLNKIAFACKGNLLNAPDQVLRSRLRSIEAQHPVPLWMTAQSILSQRRVDALADA